LLQNPNFYRQAFFSDISSDALRVAQNNYDNLVDRKDVDVRFIQSDLLDFFVSGDIVPQMPITLVANLPYIPDETFDNNALENVQKWEPRLAFVGGNDGLDLYRKMFKQLRNSQLDFVKLDITMFLEMMTRQVEILKSEF
jgi:release factor glutamine methyltransferase